MDAESLQKLCSTDPRHCYDELFKIHPKFVYLYMNVFLEVRFMRSIPSLSTKPIEFNDSLLKTSGLTNLEADTIVADDTVGDSIINILRRK